MFKIMYLALNGEEEVCSGEQVIEALRAHRWIISNEEQVFEYVYSKITVLNRFNAMKRQFSKYAGLA